MWWKGAIATATTIHYYYQVQHRHSLLWVYLSAVYWGLCYLLTMHIAYLSMEEAQKIIIAKYKHLYG